MLTPANKAARRSTRRVGSPKVNLELLQMTSDNDQAKQAITAYLQENTLPSSLDESHSYIINALQQGKA